MPIIPYSYNEKLQGRLSIATLQLDEYKHQELKMLADLARAGQEICNYAHKVGRLQEENEQLKEERAMLLQQIERTIDDQKVELPRDVAEALEKCEQWNNTRGVLLWAISGGQYTSGSEDEPYVTYRPMVLFAKENIDTLLAAMVDGYTVAPEKDEAAELLNEVSDMVQKWGEGAPSFLDFDKAMIGLSERICDFIHKRESLPL